ncbi:kinase-associated lipoprotein B [Bacillus thermotolerans]|uniref:KapB lipoprotein n=1 Tax=Bacillus thermotolerans TaxID=1221996 RepID=A0A0F5I8H2_BACTR|nr:kinase-associated lipoprotein B [Bacillus thermotolerans]KKB41929.1 KapB lipoprotein [Bacillus thermotolerans]
MQVGDIVTAFYKTGKYIGEVTGIYPDRCTVKIAAVLRHPAQGDLHNPKEVEVPFFHERKALAYREQANIPLTTIQPYEGDIPDYNASLKESVLKLRNRLEKEETAFSRKSLEALNAVQREYELMYNLSWD